MMISPAQCRAARALLTWSQEDLEKRSGVAKRTIAEFEREGRGQLQTKIEDALRAAFTEAGVELIEQNGGGDGARFIRPVPRFVRLFRRDDVDHRRWVAFAFDYKGERLTGFVRYEAIGIGDTADQDPVEVFDHYRRKILLCAAGKFDRGDLDPDGRALIQAGEIDL
ncbi:helix-turn-helix domain-containing protein [Methylobacterium sp. J-030]|uniref:helix-turn-helix domain-containing protein n=1 Tax=Methylobacterium sp. J-030 TaxID=2836627 RepID=UPI001FB939E5|nr:helix-turn-helix transcriptional regulator [Methylobacterium sp. J-030]MCJ2070579.1 helix-turn-helix domain-containing protein [Methylobacterium sp. J-030]